MKNGILVADLLITNIGQLLTMQGPSGPRRSNAARELGIVEDACLAARDGRVVAAGARSQVEPAVALAPGARVIDARGRVVTPGLIDPHTHLVFAGWRYHEYAQRCQGKTYLEIAESGGGIMSTVRETRRASKDHLVERSLSFLDQMLSFGTTTCEVKSGYGLDMKTELKQLETIERCGHLHPVRIVPTFLGAHAVPPEFRERQNEYVELVTSLLPVIKTRNLARFVDVFCDRGSFSVDEARTILSAARDLGFGLKIHADELECTGATELGCQLGAASCDHLLKVSEAGIRALARCDTVAVLLPATACFLGEPLAPARKLLDSGVAVALGTDFNPGTSTAMSLPLCMTLACSMMHVSPEEAFCAVTWNAAWAVGLGGQAGALLPGFVADAVIFDAEHYIEIPYRFGVNLVHTVIKEGAVVYTRAPAQENRPGPKGGDTRETR